MSQLGQSRRFRDVGMSASPPTTDVSLRRSEPTLWANRVISSCSKQAIIRSVRRLFDHLVGKHKERFRDCKSERLGSLEIDHQFEFRRRLHRKVTW